MCLVIVFIFLGLFNLFNKLKPYKQDVAASQRLDEVRKHREEWRRKIKQQGRTREH
jgi:hypothetical protein